MPKFVVNSILNKESSEIMCIKDEDNLLYSDEIIVEKFNEYFVNSIVHFNENIPHIDFEQKNNNNNN